ncbi:hypothetical protein [Stutzerimonas nitrititolerans]|uniref:hypothetical protein n=1 Tax=Stutzerimonas nitrititolerans TaxID=2482751 RepID=UPI0028A28603|nr:hypothetical protein [Stutzerimonas nitrititolerans]
MSIVLQRLISRGLNQPDADIPFKSPGTLIRGPSDTGKSYIRDCLWYLLGGDKVPKEIPQSKGYDSLLLQLRAFGGDVYTIKRSLFGGGAEIYAEEIEGIKSGEPLPDDIGQLLVGLSGAKEKLLLRSAAKRGPMTGGDLRHWSLLSQPAMISEDPTTGAPTEQTQRKAAFSVFLTGQDDSSVVLAQSKDEKIKLKALIAAIEKDLERVNSEIPEGKTKIEIQDALTKVDETLDMLSTQQIERSSQLREIRNSLSTTLKELSDTEKKLNQSKLMASRFNLLDDKYASDLERLRSVGDGIAVFETLENQPCLLCGTPIEKQIDMSLLAKEATQKQRIAMDAEARKIESLRIGLLDALSKENHSISNMTSEVARLTKALDKITINEKNAIRLSVAEFSADPKKLAEVRTEYAAQVKLFDELDRLKSEHSRISGLIPEKKQKPIKRQTDVDSVKVGELAQEILHSWGFKQIKTVELDASECDIKIDGRSRLTYGAGKRAIFLSAMTIALMQHAMSSDYPHLGLVVLDSPIKSYSDPENKSDVTTSPVIVRESFYDWLSKWQGPGQIIVLENEPILESTANQLLPIEFSGSIFEGRAGFYPGIKS